MNATTPETEQPPTESLTEQAIMFADVSGSSAIYKQQGNLAAKQLMDGAIRLMCELTERCGGSVVKTIGDEVMSRFERAEDACRAASAIQQQCRLLPGDGNIGLAVRIGMDFGPTLVDDGDVFGETVNDAAYVARIARSNQIVVTECLVEALPARLRNRCQAFDRVKIKGDDRSSMIYRFQWETPAEAGQATMVVGLNSITQKFSTRQLTLEFGDQLFAVTGDTVPFLIGRDHHKAHLHVDSSLASREHCQILLRRGKFMLVDHSTNGTYVTGPDQVEIFLRREELPLVGEGSIAIGRRAHEAPELTIHYRL